MGDDKYKQTILAVYVPTDDDNAENKDKFWEDLMAITENNNWIKVVLGKGNLATA